jgi:hypothetical protein
MKVPTGWHEVKLYQFKELRELKENAGFFNTQIETLAILLDVPSDDVEDFSLLEIGELFKSVKWVLSEPKKVHVDEVEIDGQTYVLKPFKKLTLDEFIDLNFFLTNDYLKHISHIVSVFYRRTKTDEWGNIEFEPYVFNPFDVFDKFDDLNVTQVYGLIPEFLKWRDDFLKKYENLFNQDSDEDLEEELDVKDFDSLAAYKEELKAQEQAKKSKKWGWESLLFDLCEGDLTKIKAVGELPLIFVFNMLSMRKEMGYLDSFKG